MTDVADYRIERDTMGEMRVPKEAMYGPSTQRAVLNFPVSGIRMPPEFIHCLGRVKRACAQANRKFGILDEQLSDLIIRAATEIAEGALDDEFPVDVFQTGSGTSTNMNANEVIANRCARMLGGTEGSNQTVHPNDHANLSQSSNDVIPTALHVSVAVALEGRLKPALQNLEARLGEKGQAWCKILKPGRTHTMDAIPMTMGQLFDGYAAQVRKSIKRVDHAIHLMEELAIGGTAVGTGLNAPDGFGSLVSEILSEELGMAFKEANNHFEAQGCRDDAVEVAGILSATASSLGKMANDIRMLGSGPRSGLAELCLPAVQPGSSIMPGKVNPVMCEMLIQVCHFVSGNCHTVRRCGQDGQFELNATLPLIAHSLHTSIDCLGNAVLAFSDKCIAGLTVDEERCRTYVEQSLMLVTALNPVIGYENAAKVAKKSYEENKSLFEVVVEMGLMDSETAKSALDPWKML